MNSKIAIAIQKMSATAVARKGIRENIPSHQIKAKIVAKSDCSFKRKKEYDLDINMIYLQALEKEKNPAIFPTSKHLVLNNFS